MVSGKRNQRLSLSRICIQDCGYQTYSQVLWLPGQLHPRAQAQGQGRPQFLGAFIPGVRAASQADPWWPGWPGSSRVFPAVTGSGPYIRIQEISPLCPQAERGTASCVIHPLLPLGPMPPRRREQPPYAFVFVVRFSLDGPSLLLGFKDSWAGS